MFSTAAIALMSGAAYADTTIDSNKTEAYTTGALLSSDTGQANAGNITVKSGNSLSVSLAQGAITVDSDNWVLNQGTISNKDKSGAHGIFVDLSADRDLSTASFTNAASATISGTGIYLDASSVLSTSGSNTGKYGIFLDASGCSAATCSYTGNITAYTGSSLSVTGDSSAAVEINSKAILNGTLTLGGVVDVAANTDTNNSGSTTGVFGVFSQGQINGNVVLPSGGSMAVSGEGARGISIQGGGVNGYISIGGTVTTTMPVKQTVTISQKLNTTTNPEAGPALEVGSNVTGGIAILGPASSGTSSSSATITVGGTGPAIVIAQSVSGSTAPLTVGVYTNDTADPGFSFYNRGTVSIAPNDYNDSASVLSLAGYDATDLNVLTGGLFNSGTLSSAVTSSGTGASSGVYALGITIGSYAQLGTGTNKLAADSAALVNSGALGTSTGVISAAVVGSRGGTAEALLIGANASVPSIINSGSITAVATTTDKTLTGNEGTSPTNPLMAGAIVDQSGTVTSILNQGTIQASAGYVATTGATPSPLDNNSQIAFAVNLAAGSATSPSAGGVTIKNWSSASRAAVITGDIVFGTGNNQVLDLVGNGPTLMSTITGNVTYGMIATGSTSGDILHVGNYASLTGQVVTLETVKGAGVTVNVDTNGYLTLLNTGTSLNANTFTVANGGDVNLGVNESLTATGGVVAAQSVNFQSGSILGVAYASFVPQTEHQFVLMTANQGQLQIDPVTLSAFNATTNRPYLLATANLCLTTQSGCPRPSSLPSNLDALVLDVAPKAPTGTGGLGLTVGSVTLQSAKTLTGQTTLFDQANIALSVDNDLGAAMINGVHSATEAQQAYNEFAPNLTGGTRAIAISITDQATGPVGARQRMLNMYGKTDGEMTLWGQQFVEMLKDPGRGQIDPNTNFKVSPGFKDHGFGFALGLDGGSPKYGWYGGAFTFYAGDVNELSRDSHENQQWYLLSLYSVWRGKGLFVDTKLDAGYGHVDGSRTLNLVTSAGSYLRVADNKHAGALISGGLTTGAMFSYGAATLLPQLSLDGLYVREEGYTEYNPNTTTVGDGFDLKVNSSYAKSLRVFAGVDLRYDLDLWDFYLQPEARAGYRYDFANDPLKLKLAFAYADTSNSLKPAPGTEFTLTGPDPSQGNFVLGGGLAATTDSWTLGLSFDMVRGSNGSLQQIGTLSLLGRI